MFCETAVGGLKYRRIDKSCKFRQIREETFSMWHANFSAGKK